MTDTSDQAVENNAEEQEELIDLKTFFERVHPATMKKVSNLWSSKDGKPTICAPDIRLHCVACGGERTFRSESEKGFYGNSRQETFSISYQCGDCHKETKLYSLFARIGTKDRSGDIYKYGELPPFGIPVSNKVLRLFGGDAEIFKKGRQCENLGYGVGAFAYYRRVVENHKNDIFDAIIKVCETLGQSAELIAQLHSAKAEISFSKSLEHIKSGLPQGLLINGHNPLEALHGALSGGLHSDADEDCLEAASAVRLVLTDLTEKIAQLRQEDAELKKAVRFLLEKKARDASKNDAKKRAM